MKKENVPLIYKWRAAVAGTFVVFGLITAWFDPYKYLSINLQYIGFSIAFIGILFRLWGCSYVWPNIDSIGPEAHQGLMTAGPYSLVRNHIYFGSILHIIGFNFVFGSPLAIITMTIPTILFNYWQGKKEEAYFFKRYGEYYARYKKAVPLLFPRLFSAKLKEKNGTANLLWGIRRDVGPQSGYIIILLGIIALTFWEKSTNMTWITGVFIFHFPLAMALVYITHKLWPLNNSSSKVKV